MTAVTLVDDLEVNDPGVEAVVVTASDGNTFTSKKFGDVRTAQATLQEDTTTLSIPISCAISGGVVTLHCTGLSSTKVALELRGKL